MQQISDAQKTIEIASRFNCDKETKNMVVGLLIKAVMELSDQVQKLEDRLDSMG